MNRIKMKRDKESPWHMPLYGTIFPLGWTFMRTRYLTVVTNNIIHSIHVSEKPICFITYLISFYSIWSYVLRISDLIAIPLFLPHWLALSAWNIFWVIILLYVIYLPVTKTDWVSEIGASKTISISGIKKLETIL